MDSTVLSGVKLLLPYAASALVATALVVFALVRLRSPLRRALAIAGGSVAEGGSRICLLFALALLAFLASIEVISIAGYAVGIESGFLAVALSALVAAAATFIGAKAVVGAHAARSIATWVVAAAMISVALSLGAASSFYDISWDGNWYHQQAVVAIGEGWNPLFDPEGETVKVGEWEPDRTPEGIWDFAVTHYSKGGWLRQGALYDLTGSLEGAKGTNLIVLIAAFASWLALAFKVIGSGIWRRLLLAVLAVANPVTIVQLFTYKNDGHLGSLFTAAVALGCLTVAGAGWPAGVALFCVLLMLATIKFTGMVYAALLAIGFAAAYVWLRRDGRAVKAVALALAVLLVATFAIGYNPYIQNTVDHGFPFHPLMGPQAIDADSEEYPAASWPTNFQDTTSVERLFLSLFSRAADEAFIEPGGDVARLKVPFAFSASEIRPYMGYDTRVAGFGPFFSGALVLALVLAVPLALSLRARRDPVVLWGFALVALLVVTVLVNPESWWARYAPQIWLVPVVLVGIAFRERWRKASLGIAVAISAVLLLNAAFVGTINFANLLNGDREIEMALDEIDAWPGTVSLELGDFAVTWVKLEERGIPWRIAGPTTPREGGFTIPYTTTTAYPER